MISKQEATTKMTDLIHLANVYLIVTLNNNEYLYITLYHIYPVVILMLYLQYFWWHSVSVSGVDLYPNTEGPRIRSADYR